MSTHTGSVNRRGAASSRSPLGRLLPATPPVGRLSLLRLSWHQLCPLTIEVALPLHTPERLERLLQVAFHVPFPTRRLPRVQPFVQMRIAPHGWRGSHLIRPRTRRPGPSGPRLAWRALGRQEASPGPRRATGRGRGTRRSWLARDRQRNVRSELRRQRQAEESRRLGTAQRCPVIVVRSILSGGHGRRFTRRATAHTVMAGVTSVILG